MLLKTILFAAVTAAAVGATAEETPPPEPPIDEILEGKFDYQPVFIRGRVKDVIVDPLGGKPLNYFVMLDVEGRTIYMPIQDVLMSADEIYALLGAKIRVLSMPCLGSRQANRKQSGRVFHFYRREELTVLEPGRYNPFDAAEYEPLGDFPPHLYPTLGNRRLRGRVLATWGGDNVLILNQSNELMRVELLRAHPPAYDSVVEFAGIPDTDTYRVNLVRAEWRPAPAAEAPRPDAVRGISAAELVSAQGGNRTLDLSFYGKTVRLTGRVKALPEDDGRVGMLYVESDRRLVPVRTDSVPSVLAGLERDATVEVTGTCVFHIESWRSNVPFPRITGYSIVLRTPADLVVVARPPWWTPARFAAAVAVLLALLVAIIVWNRSLKVIADRRGRELLRERIGGVRSKLQVVERTRLAVELHDTLSQTLAGVAMQIETAQAFGEGADAKLLEHLGIADKALDSCREELRNCLWDLRSDTLNEKDLSEAIRKTLLPHCANVGLVIRFNVARKLLSDKAVHSILQIIRELTLNGIRHGGATQVKIAGAYERGRLLFSVADNGSGFDPDTRPGVAQGHFGLQGVKERVGSLNGTIRFDTAPGRGTKATVSISAEQTGE